MRAAVLAAVLVVLVLYTLFRGVPERWTVDRLEMRLASATVEGTDTVPVGAYARYYAEARPKAWNELGFTTPPPAGTAPPPRGRTVIAGVLVRPADGETGGPGIRRVRANELPVIEDGGCSVVNVLYDPKEDELLGAWCNGRGQPPAAP